MFNTSTHNIQNINNENINIATQINYGVVQGPVLHVEHYNTYEQQNLESVDTIDGCRIEFQISIPISFFPGRENELEQIKQLLIRSTCCETSYKMVAICGFPGIGKSECAKQYIFKNRAEYKNIMWINAETNNNIENSFQDLANKLKLPTSDCQDIYNKLCGETLFVFDNIKNMKILKKFLPNKPNNFCFLLTTQNKDWGNILSIELKKLKSKDAVAVLRKILGNYSENIDERRLAKLANSLDHIPLTLQIGAHYILQQVKNDEFFQQQFKIEHYIDAVEFQKSIIITEEFPDSSSNQYSNSVYKTICLSLENITKNDNPQTQLAYCILSVISYLNPDYIKQSHLLEISEFENKELLLKNSIIILIKYSIVHIENCSYLFRKYKKIHIHRLIQECLRYHHYQKKIDIYYKIALQLLLKEENDYDITIHYESIMKYAEEHFGTFLEFYIKHKAERLNKLLLQFGSKELLIRMFKKLNSNIDPSFLFISVIMEQTSITSLLLEQGMNPNEKNREGRTPLHYARSEECIELLISKGTLLNTRDSEGETPLYYAFRHRPWKIVKYLIQSGADVNLTYENNKTLLHLLPSMTSVSNIDLSKVKTSFLIKYGAKCDVRDKYGFTPIDEALRHNCILLADLMKSEQHTNS